MVLVSVVEEEEAVERVRPPQEDGDAHGCESDGL